MFRLSAVLIPILALAPCGCARNVQPPIQAQAPANDPVLVERTAPGSTPASEPTGEPHTIATQSHAPTAPPAKEDRPKLKSRFGRMLVEQLDRVEGGADAERNLIHETLRKNDDTVDRALTDLKGRIEAANNTHDGRRRIYI